MADKKIKVTIEKQEGSMVEITGSVAWADLEKRKAGVLAHLAKEAEVDGFRKGKAPAEKVEEHYGTMRVLSEAAQAALSDLYPRIILENDIKIMGSPDMGITKLAEGNDLEFKITTAVFPEMKIGDYKKIAKKFGGEEIKVSVEEKEVTEAIEQIRKMNAHMIDEDQEHDENCNHDGELPELNDTFVTSLGDFKDVADFKEKLEENIRLQKVREEQAKSREAMMTELIADSTFDVPEVLIQSELEKMVAQMKDDVARMGLEFEGYLKHMGKTEEELAEQWQPDAKKRAQSELILKEIARAEEVKPDAEKVAEQIEVLRKQYGAEVPEANMRLYVESIFLKSIEIDR